MKHLKYLIYLFKHKWFVLLAGLRVGGIPFWRLLVHDYTKFSKAEWSPYVDRFFRGNSGKEDKTYDPDSFKEAWKHHWQNNPHHWEYWVNHLGARSIYDNTHTQFEEAQIMPVTYVREMVADWIGAGRAITGKWGIEGWYNNTKGKQNLHYLTRQLVEDILKEVNYGVK
jgi:hypothetical protein